MIDDTHDPKRRSWVESANRPRVRLPDPEPAARRVPRRRARRGRASASPSATPSSTPASGSPGETLNGYFALSAHAAARSAAASGARRSKPERAKRPLYRQADCAMLLPAAVGDYTDFYASIHHATNVGRMFRPDNPLLPNYKHVPIAYHGRVVVAGRERHAGAPAERPTRRREVRPDAQSSTTKSKLGAFLGPGNALGEPIPLRRRSEHIAGVCLVNDWSARDIQRWEYQPLGPFLAKNFATSRLAVGGHDGGARPVPHRRDAARRPGPAVPAGRRRGCIRHHGRSLAANRRR